MSSHLVTLHLYAINLEVFEFEYEFESEAAGMGEGQFEFERSMTRKPSEPPARQAQKQPEVVTKQDKPKVVKPCEALNQS